MHEDLTTSLVSEAVERALGWYMAEAAIPA